MTVNTSRQDPSAAIFAEASAWLVDFREGDVDAEGRRRFNAWLRRSPEHIRAYMEAAALWGDIPKLAGNLDVDIDAVVARARAQRNVTPVSATLLPAPASVSAAPTPRTSAGRFTTVFRTRWHWTFAAVAIAAVTAALLMAWWGLDRGSVYATQIGEQRTIALADNSIVELGARSRVRVHMSSVERHIELLAGQALFKVTKDAARPFIVTSGNARVRAVGTQFDVHRRRSGTTITVLEGRVAIVAGSASSFGPPPNTDAGGSAGAGLVPEEKSTRSVPSTSDVDAREAGHHPLYVSAGEQVTVPVSSSASHRGARIAQALPLRTVDTAAIAAHSERTLTFENAPLAEVVEEFNRYNAKQMVLADHAIASLRLSGVFSATRPESLLRFLDTQMKLEVTSTERQIAISPRSTEVTTAR
jgi:transmembrane sensor